MAITHFAQLDDDNTVISIEIVDYPNTLDGDGNHSEDVGIKYLKSIHGGHTVWVETLYDASSRQRFAGIGMTYSFENYVFTDIKPEQYPSWVVNTETYAYEPPVAEPTLTEEQLANGDLYVWNESTVSWDFVEGPGEDEPPAEEEET